MDKSVWKLSVKFKEKGFRQELVSFDEAEFEAKTGGCDKIIQTEDGLCMYSSTYSSNSKCLDELFKRHIVLMQEQIEELQSNIHWFNHKVIK